MNIINSDIVRTEFDIFWQDVTAYVQDMVPKPVMVITRKMAEGSQEQAQLLKMLEVSKLLPEHYNIVNVGDGERMSWHGIREALKPVIVFLIGVLPIELGVSALFRMNEPNRFNDTIWLPTCSLTELEQRPDIKKHLWVEGMKPIFVDKKYGEIKMSEPL